MTLHPSAIANFNLSHLEQIELRIKQKQDRRGRWFDSRYELIVTDLEGEVIKTYKRSANADNYWTDVFVELEKTCTELPDHSVEYTGFCFVDDDVMARLASLKNPKEEEALIEESSGDPLSASAQIDIFEWYTNPEGQHDKNSISDTSFTSGYIGC